MLDVTYYRIDVGDDVAFIRNDSQRENQPEIRRGTVQKITPQSVTILESGGDLHRLVDNSCHQGDEEPRLKKVAVLSPRERRGGPSRDATGYPVMRGDTVVFRGPADMLRFSKELIVGRVERMTVEYAYVFEYETEKTARRMISKLAVIEPKQKGKA